jgi:multidrug efflux pump subunit AcrA (membrane-fusion protein)
MNTNVDLSQLALRRDPLAPPLVSRRRHLVSRYFVPGVILLGFVAVLGWAARDQLLPAQPVTVVPVLATRAEVRQAGAPLFTAAGWVEPRPTPIVVTALTEGVIEELLVVENQPVRQGEPVARLIDEDTRLQLKRAEAALRLVQAKRDSARAELAAAQTNFQYPVKLQAELADAEAMLAQKQSELDNLPFEIEAARARLQLAGQDYEGKSRAASSVQAVSGRDVQRAESALAAAKAAVEGLTVRQPRLEQEVGALSRRRDALARQLELKTEEQRQLALAEAQVKSAEAVVRQAEVEVETLELQRERLTVLAPADGCVLHLLARPGTRVMGLAVDSPQDASTVVTLYDPANLQVRADVRLDDLPRMQLGQPVRIKTAALAEPLMGEVLLATSLADIQKNTLQVKVAIHEPPPALRPDMLVEAVFLAPDSPGSDSSSSEQLRIYAPRHLIDVTESGAHTWIADQAAGVARKRSVTLGESSGELVEIVQGLTPADKLISSGRESLRDGQRIAIQGEDVKVGAL